MLSYVRFPTKLNQEAAKIILKTITIQTILPIILVILSFAATLIVDTFNLTIAQKLILCLLCIIFLDILFLLTLKRLDIIKKKKLRDLVENEGRIFIK
jgi:hypothetical protein